MTYPGNRSLSEEIRERITTTFEQTLDLAAEGRLQEARTGCNFVLQLDPLLEPARTLKDRLESATGPVATEDLRMSAEGTTAPAAEGAPGPEPAAEPSEEVFDLSPAAGDQEPTEPIVEPPAAPPSGEKPDASAHDEGTERLEAALDLSMLGSTAETPDTVEPAAPPEQVPVASDGGSAASEDEPAGEPAAALDAESEGRITELLAEGQAAFEEKQYQSAIDAWSRIFLVDIDHAEASRRIELARKLKAEVERQVEETFHEAVAQVEGGDFDAAREGFQRVLEMHPSHLSAQEYLEKLDSGGFAPPSAEPAPPSVPPAAPTIDPGPDDPGLAAPVEDSFGDALGSPADETTVEAPKGPPPQAKPQRPPAKQGRFRPSLLYLGGAVLLLVLAGIWFLWSNWDSTFPNAGDQPVAQKRPRIDPIARAMKVHDDGNAALAIAQLKRLPPSHERYAEAQALIAQWEAPAEEEEVAEVVTAEQTAARDLFVQQAQSAADRREFLLAQDLLTQAADSAPLEEGSLALQNTVEQALAPLATELEIFRQGEWAHGLRKLWTLRESNPTNPDIQRLMVDSYYNLGVRDLQRQEPLTAVENLTEALQLAGADPEVQRLLDFARAYEKQPVDLLYRIFVKYVPFR